MIQAMSGLMSITGFESNGPTRVGFAGADVMSGATAAFGVASALYQRTHTGKGQLVDVAMIDAVMGYLAQQFTEHLMTGRVHEQAANLSVTRKPTGDLFKTKDGWMVLAVMTEPQFQRLMKVLGREDALADPRFVDWPTRIENNKALHEIVEEAMKKETSATWAERFRQGRRPGRPGAQHPRDRAARPHAAPHRAAGRRHAARPDQGRRIRLPPGARRRFGRPAARDAGPAHRRGAGRGGLLGRRDRRHTQEQRRLARRGRWRSLLRHRNIDLRHIRYLNGEATPPAEIGPCLRHFGKARGRPIGQRELAVGLGEVAVLGSLPRRLDVRPRLVDPCLVAVDRAQLRQPVRPRPILVVLGEALRIFSEQTLGLPQLFGGQRLVDRRVVLRPVAIALPRSVRNEAISARAVAVSAKPGTCLSAACSISSAWVKSPVWAKLRASPISRRASAWRSCASRSARALASFCCSGGQAA